LVYASLFLIPPSSATNISPLSLHDALPIYKAYLFADPFTRPVSFSNGEYKVFDPSFDNRPTVELVKEFGWMRERVLQIRLALLPDGRRLVPLSEYFELCKTVDRGSH